MKFTLSSQYNIEYELMDYFNGRLAGNLPINLDVVQSTIMQGIPRDVLERELSDTMRLGDIIENYGVHQTPSFEFLFKSISDNLAVYPASLVRRDTHQILDSLSHVFGEQFDSLNQLKQWIVTSNLEEFDKYRLSIVLNDQPLIHEMIEDVMEGYQPLIKKLDDIYRVEFPEYLATFDLDSIRRFIEMNQFEFKDNSEIIVNLTPLVPLNVRVNAKDEVDGLTPIHFFLAPKTLNLIDVSEELVNYEQDFMEAAKILSEPKKLEILKLCLNSPKYGTELAKELELTGATVSHHVNLLVSKNYLSIQVDKNRVYYKTNVKRILDDIHTIDVILKGA